MPRTAITIAVTHDGKDELIAGKTVSILEQQKNFRAMKGTMSHPDFSEVCYQESDGSLQVIRLLTPEDEKAKAKARSGEIAQAKKAQADASKAKADQAAKALEERRAKIKASLDANQNKLTEAVVVKQSKK